MMMIMTMITITIDGDAIGWQLAVVAKTQTNIYQAEPSDDNDDSEWKAMIIIIYHSVIIAQIWKCMTNARSIASSMALS